MFYSDFYRRYGIRFVNQLISPPLPNLDRLELPQGSIYHYPGSGPTDQGPAPDEYLFRNIERPIFVSHVVENGAMRGNPIRQPINIDPVARRYFTQYRRYRPLPIRGIVAMERDKITQVVYNYSYIYRLYRYQRSIFADYNRWWNIQAAIWQNVNALAKTSDRQQFIPITLPQVLPSVGDLFKGGGDLTQQVLKLFPTPEHQILLELWKWLGPNRHLSILNMLEPSSYDKVNLLYQEAGRWTTVNLGVLNRARKATKEEREAGTNLNEKGVLPEQLQKIFLRFNMVMFEARSVTPPVFKDDVTDEFVDDDVSQNATGNVPGTQSSPSTAVNQAGDAGTVIKIDASTPVVNPVTGTVEKKNTASALPDEATTPETPIGIDAAREFNDNLDDVLVKIDSDLEKLEEISKMSVDLRENEGSDVLTEEPTDLVGGVMAVVNRYSVDGMMTAADYKRHERLASTYKTLLAPDGINSLENFMEVPREEIMIDKIPTLADIGSVTDKTMLQSTLLEFDRRYTERVLPRDVARMVMNIQNAGISVTNYTHEREADIMGSYDKYTVRVVPVEGVPSTLRFKIPVVDRDGYYTANGVKYRIRKQRGDLPIRKVGPNKVSLTSYYGKTFITRSEKKTNNYQTWLTNAIMSMGLNMADTTITNIVPGVAFDPDFPAPRLFTMLSQRFQGFTLTPSQETPGVPKQSYAINLQSERRDEMYGADVIRAYEKEKLTILGKGAGNGHLLVDENDALYHGENNHLTELGSLEDILGLNTERAPVEFSGLKVMGEEIPIGVILAYELGIEKLMRMLKATPRRVEAGRSLGLMPHEWAIAFADQTLIFSRDDRYASMILGGFLGYHKAVRQYNLHEFDKKDVYLNVLESNGLGARYLREIELMHQMFIDPITKSLLEEMKEPTTFRGLLLRGSELLLTDQHPHELDADFMRVKGYERMAGAVYTELVKSIREHNGKNGKSRFPIDLNPYAVWQAIASDPSKVQSNETNPIQNLKEISMLTYSGSGGRSGRSMVRRTREYHRNDMGVVSEATVDSGDVAINTYLSANPQFTSLYGTAKPYVADKDGATSLLSASALISPAADQDDPKRVNFIGIQHTHGISCKGYHQNAVRTGYEQIVGHCTGDLFATSAKKPGKVKSVNATGIVVVFDDGEEMGIELGRRYGNAAGLTIPHSVRSPLRAGDVFKAGDFLAYNDGYFEPDMLNPRSVVWKSSLLVNTVLLESPITLEDSSSISRKVANALQTKVTKTRSIVINFTDVVHQLVKVGQQVKSEDILCIIEEAVTANAELFSEASLDTLRAVGQLTPQAKAKGVVERIEIFYNGELEDMSDSLRNAAIESDKAMAARYKSSGRQVFTGAVKEDFRVDGNPLMLDTVCIKVYITSDVSAGVGDKGVFGNQLKTVFGKVMESPTLTESNKEIDAVFGAKSVGARIVNSPFVIGTTNALLAHLTKKMIKAYRG